MEDICWFLYPYRFFRLRYWNNHRSGSWYVEVCRLFFTYCSFIWNISCFFTFRLISFSGFFFTFCSFTSLLFTCGFFFNSEFFFTFRFLNSLFFICGFLFISGFSTCFVPTTSAVFLLDEKFFFLQINQILHYLIWVGT